MGMTHQLCFICRMNPNYTKLRHTLNIIDYKTQKSEDKKQKGRKVTNCRSDRLRMCR